ncbi:hypothetical protein D8674_034051 [Pyrus ussuriensis x Pyrus communis]|uniref:RNase H type-1 domain-containing protein n=1 Tax=Pyrus ussuriensis x Pyrus communis TaxID=2448454 RepID=A0A5N5HMS5_9ROSA|nr:hypothetical protein D8674_034051 [Pyrus ussuriensis x Pyrus communis]
MLIPHHTNSPKWTPPPLGSLKMNIDGAWISSRRLGGVGLIVRDDSGGFLAVKAIVEALRDPSINLSSIGQIIEDIEALRSSITEVCFTHTHRHANQAAHRLARFG